MNWFTKIKTYILSHKVISAIVLILLVGGGYFGYTKLFNKEGIIRYASAAVQKGTLIVSITASGQVSASDQVDVKPKTSGQITGVYVKSGQSVVAGQVIAQIDASDASRALRDAKTSLETAKLQLDKLQAPTDQLTLLQSQNSVTDAQESKQKSQDTLTKTYTDSLNTVSDTFLDLPPIMTGLDEVLHGQDIKYSQQSNIGYYSGEYQSYTQDDDANVEKYSQLAESSYAKALATYNKNLDNYKVITRASSTQDIEAVLDETYQTSQDIADAVKNATTLIQLYKQIFTRLQLNVDPAADTHISKLNSYTSTINNHLSSLLSDTKTIKDSKNAITDADRTIREKELSLQKTQQGADSLDIRSAQITIQQKEDALVSANQDLADTVVRAPFAGIMATVAAKKGDNASSGTAVGTLVTKQRIAEISLGEIDASKIKIGQKVTLTFDAIPNLTITGEVAQIDTLGAVSQGVVTYSIKIGFDTQDERVKPSMSVSAAIVTEAKTDVLLIPNSALKQQGGVSYVEAPAQSDMSVATANLSGAVLNSPTQQKPIEVGISNDEFTEVTGGLQEGDLVITRTIKPTTTQATSSQQSSSLRIPGLTGGGGAGLRTGGGTGR